MFDGLKKLFGRVVTAHPDRLGQEEQEEGKTHSLHILAVSGHIMSAIC